MSTTNCATLASGAVIDGAATFGNGAANLFRPGGTFYMGFRFTNTVTTEVNYGYAEFTTTGTLGFPATLNRYWYNSAGDPITIP
jgi:hypothetical protein